MGSPTQSHLSKGRAHKWEKSMRETSYICNQAAGFNRCMTKLQEEIQEHVKILRRELAKGKGSQGAKKSVNELRNFCAFIQIVSVCFGKFMQHMTDSLFVTMANLALLHRDGYLNHLKPGVKQNNLCALRNAPLQSYGLFPDDALHRAEDDIKGFETTKWNTQSTSGSDDFAHKIGNRFPPYPSPPAGSWKQDSNKSRSSGNHVLAAWRSL